MGEVAGGGGGGGFSVDMLWSDGAGWRMYEDEGWFSTDTAQAEPESVRPHPHPGHWVTCLVMGDE